MTPDDLGIYLGIVIDADDPRAGMILRKAQSLCESVVSPLPVGADAVVVDVATRAWSNPANVQSETTGPFSDSYGAVSGGLWLTSQNRQTLRRLAGRGGAFTIDTMPAAAGQNLGWWDVGVLPADSGDAGPWW